MTELAPQTYGITRADLVRYAGASGDFNPIHWSDRVAAGVGLPGVIAHGMLTMALAGRLVTQWAGGPAAVRSYGVGLTRPGGVRAGKTALGRAQAEVALPGCPCPVDARIGASGRTASASFRPSACPIRR